MTADIEEMTTNSTETAANRAEIDHDIRENDSRNVKLRENAIFAGISAGFGRNDLPRTFPDWNCAPTLAIPTRRDRPSRPGANGSL